MAVVAIGLAACAGGRVDYSGRYLFVVSDTDSSVTTYTIDAISGALAPVSPATVIGAAPKGLAISRIVETH